MRSKDGLTTGAYQLQVRQRENDEFPGSTVRFADIRYANNGIEVIGLPAHSPLLGEAAEDEAAVADATFLGPTLNFADNGSMAQNPLIPGNRPQDIGNLLESDRATISIAGTVSGATDVDFYTFDVTYQGIESRNQPAIPGIHDVRCGLCRRAGAIQFHLERLRWVPVAGLHWPRFERGGRSSWSASRERSGRPVAGTIGPKDPFIGPVELQEGQYFAAVTSNSVMPAELEQFTSAFPSNPLVRLEPVNSLVRMAEDHIESSGGSTAQPPIMPQLLDPAGGTGLWHVTDDRSTGSGSRDHDARAGDPRRVSRGSEFRTAGTVAAGGPSRRPRHRGRQDPATNTNFAACCSDETGIRARTVAGPF